MQFPQPLRRGCLKSSASRDLSARQRRVAGKSRQTRETRVATLAESAEDAEYTVTSLYERDPRLLRFLHETGIEPGGAVRVLKKNYDQTLSHRNPSRRRHAGRAGGRKGLGEAAHRPRREAQLVTAGAHANSPPYDGYFSPRPGV